MSGSMEKRITAKFVLDSTGFNDSLKGINAGLRNVQGELKNASTQVGVYGKDTEKLKSVQDALGKQYELQAKKVDVYKESIEKTSSKMQENIKERDRLKNSLKNANSEYEKAVQLYGKESQQAQQAKAKVSELEQEYKKKEQAIESNAKSIERYEGNLNRANAQMTKTQGELNKINAELERSQNKWIQAGEALTGVGDKMQSVGKGMTTVGNGILKATAPLVGLGVAALKVSADFESGMSEVQAISGATGSGLKQLEEKAKEMGATTKFSATESAEALKFMAMAGWKTEEMLGGLEGVMMLAAASGEHLGTVSDIVTDSMTAFGLSAEEAGRFADVLAAASTNSNTNVGMMGETFKYVAPLAGSLGYTIEDTALAVGLMANAGIKGSQAGTALRGAITNLANPTDKMKSAMTELGISITDASGEMLPLGDVISQLREKFSGLSEEQQAQMAATIFGKEAMSGMLAIINASEEDFNKLQGAISNSTGTAKEMADVMNDNLAGQLTLLKSELEGVGIQLGQTLIPMARDFIGVMSDWTQKFSELSPHTQDLIVKAGLLTVGLGGLLSVGGKVISGGGAILSLAGSLATQFGLVSGATTAVTTGLGGIGAAGTVAAGSGATGLAGLTAGLGGAVVAAAPFIAAGAAVVGAGYAIHKSLQQEVIPTVDLFEDKIESTATSVTNASDAMEVAYSTSITTISEGTKKAVGAYIDLDDQATNALNSLYINATTITEETKTEIVEKYAEMGKQVTSQIEKDKQEDLKILQDYFSKSSSLSEQEEAEILTTTTQHYTDKQNVVNNAQAQIATILQQASQENRALTREEQQEINSIQEEQRENAVRVLSEQEVEAQVILERMKEYDNRITAEQASEHIQTLNKQRDDAIQVANDEYNQRIATIIRMRDEAGVISAEQAEKLIADAKRQRDGIITSAEETRNGAVSRITNMNSELKNSVDLTTGKILSQWDKLKNWWNNWKPGSKKFEVSTTHINEYVTKTAPSEGSPRLPSSPSTPSWGVRNNWTGNDNFEGGLTTLHEKGYEVYDLPKGTRIFNHEASQDQVLKTAEAVARRIVSSTQGSGGTTQNVTINSPSPLSPSEVARRFKNVNKELALGI